MTPQRLAAVTANCPSLSDFQRGGAIITVTGLSFAATYELVMFLDGFTSLNQRLGPGVNAMPAPEPVRHYEIRCEGATIQSGAY